MKEWLDARRAGQINVPQPDEPTSVLRPSRATTFREKRHKEKKRLKEAAKKAEQEPEFEDAADAEDSGFFAALIQEAAAVAESSGEDGSDTGSDSGDVTVERSSLG
eukprot:SAG11_NODE_2695_length_3081_cov_1.330315_1_plen_105_part_10